MPPNETGGSIGNVGIAFTFLLLYYLSTAPDIDQFHPLLVILKSFVSIAMILLRHLLPPGNGDDGEDHELPALNEIPSSRSLNQPTTTIDRKIDPTTIERRWLGCPTDYTIIIQGCIESASDARDSGRPLSAFAMECALRVIGHGLDISDDENLNKASELARAHFAHAHTPVLPASTPSRVEQLFPIDLGGKDVFDAIYALKSEIISQAMELGSVDAVEIGILQTTARSFNSFIGGSSRSLREILRQIRGSTDIEGDIEEGAREQERFEEETRPWAAVARLVIEEITRFGVVVPPSNRSGGEWKISRK